MNTNLNTLFEKILNDDIFVENMCKYTTLEELYQYCSSCVGGYSIDEFKEFLETMILLNSKISGKFTQLHDESLNDLSGGIKFSSAKNKVIASLMCGLLFTSCGASAFVNSPQEIQDSASISQNINDNQKNPELNEKILDNLSEKAKQAINAVSDVAERCIGTILDVVLPEASAAPKKTKPKVNSWPTASSVTVGQTVGDSKLSGGRASVSGRFAWMPNIVNEKLVLSGTATYICQFIPDDQEHYTKVTNTISFNVKEKIIMRVTWPTASSITYGQSVRKSKLSGGYSNVDGHFEWDKSIANSCPSAGNKRFKVVFKPDDSRNYKETSSFVDIYVHKATPRIKSNPSGSPIDYGQPLKDSKFWNFSIMGNIPGKLKWVNGNEILLPGNYTRKAIFTPDDTSSCCTLELYVPVHVNKQCPTISFNPRASSIVYGQSVNCSNIDNFYSNVSGSLYWDNPDLKLEAGTHQVSVTFVPYENHLYDSLRFFVDIHVNKATPRLDNKYFQKVYTPNLYLKNFSLPQGWKWETPDLKIDQSGKLHCTAICPETKNTYENKETVTIDIEKATPDTPTISNMTYNPHTKLRDISLPDGWHWSDPDETPCVSKSHYKAHFDGTNIYKGMSNVDVKINVSKAAPIVTSNPTSTQITYGQELNNSKIADFCANIAGNIGWQNPNAILPAGNNTPTAIFTPSDSSNYQNLEIPVSIFVDKAIPKLENKNYTEQYKPEFHLRDLNLPNGWEWQTPDAALADLGEFNFKAIHNEDNNYYQNTEDVTVNVVKATPTLSLPDIIYNEKMKLSDIELPKGWHFLYPNETPIVSQSSYSMNFDANEVDAHFYNSIPCVSVQMNVKPAKPKIEKLPEPETTLVFGNLTEPIKLVNGIASTPGEFQLIDDISCLDTGTHTCKFKFIPESENYESITENIDITIEKNMTPENPPEVTIGSISRTDTEISISLSHCDLSTEFSIDGGKTWQNSSTFQHLSPDTKYEFAYRTKDNKNRCASKISDVKIITTKKSAPPAPDKPKVKSYTNHQIMIEKNSLLEFSIDGGKTWQDSPVFLNLKSSTKYKIISRFKETDDQMMSASSTPIEVKTRNWFTNFFYRLFK